MSMKIKAVSYTHLDVYKRQELGFLTAHSMLHLLGYDHMTEDEEKVMFAKQDDILNEIGLRR